MPANTLLTAIRAHLKLDPMHSVVIEPITKGASGRTIIRLKPEGHPFLTFSMTIRADAVLS